MRIMVVDDEKLAVESLVKVLRKEQPDAEIISFIKPMEAFDYLAENPVDIAFLDIEMGAFSGLSLAKKCKDLCPGVNIIFVTGFSQYSMEALKLHVSGYLMKPVRAEELHIELDNLRYPVKKPGKNRVRIQTFGNFEVFIDNNPLYLPRTKCRECLAYLVDRKGVFIGAAELAAVFWEDRPYDRTVQNNVHRVVSDLMKALKEQGIEDIIIKGRGKIAIDMEKVDCDYFGFLRGDVSQINAFHGEYMTNYSWAEFTLSQIIKSSKKY